LEKILGRRSEGLLKVPFFSAGFALAKSAGLLKVPFFSAGFALAKSAGLPKVPKVPPDFSGVGKILGKRGKSLIIC
jgi:hypothetical protein